MTVPTYDLRVQKKIFETAEACSLVLEIPEEHKSKFIYRPGQFITFFLILEGKAVNRSYSLSTSPLTDTEFKVTVKKVPGGKGSTYLCDRVKVGDVLKASPPAGHFFSPPKEMGGVNYFLFAAGSGITPLFSILKTVLTANPENFVNLFFCNKDANSIIYREELDEFAAQWGDRLHVVHHLSLGQGRVNESQITRFIESRRKSIPEEHYMCGPIGFMKLVQEVLSSQRVDKGRIHTESFGESLNPPVVEAEGVYIGDPPSSESTPQTLVVRLDGETIEIPAKADTSVLETLLAAGYNPPYSCMEGACLACMAKVVEGRVHQTEPGILTDENIAERDALTCQCRPVSSLVRIDYDQI